MLATRGFNSFSKSGPSCKKPAPPGLGTVYSLLLTVEPLSVLSETKIKVESSSFQIVLTHTILRKEKNYGELFHCIY